MPALQHAITKRRDKNDPCSCKKKCAAPEKAIVKKGKSKVAAKKRLRRLIAKILITKIQVNLVPNPSKM